MLNIHFLSAADKKGQVLGFFIPDSRTLGKEAALWDKRLDGALTQALKASPHFKGKEGQLLALFVPGKEAVRFILIGTGKGDAPERIGAKAAIALEKEGFSALTLYVEKGKLAPQAFAARFAQGVQLRLHRFDKYKTKKKDDDKEGSLTSLSLIVHEAAQAKKLFESLRAVNEGVFFARELAYEPANILYPESFAQKAAELKKLGVKVQVLDEKQMEKLGMGSLLCVAKGSAQPARLVVMTWPGKGKAPITLVGKGVTFDSGGISLKPGAGMWDMKYDMCGAAAVIGTMKALAARKAKVHVVGLIGLVENMPSGTATRPGDIVISASGQTIEVQNTDAEGRLVLADVLWYAQKHVKPRLLVDLATLTGAMRISLGGEYAGLFSNDNKLTAALLKAGEETGEKLWRMPLCEGYDKKIDSTVADMKNIGGPEAGSSTAAQFLQRFVNKGMPWAHLDIASVAYDNKGNAFAPEGPAGFGVRLLNAFIDSFEA